MSQSYFQMRMAQLGLKPGEELVEIPDANTGEGRQAKLFSESEMGDIQIHYYQLNGAPYSYRKGSNKWSETFVRRRLKTPIGDAKYLSPPDQGLKPWFTPELIWKYNRGEKISQLHCIEGEFKAFAGSRIGIDAMGMGSIHGFYAQKYTERDTHVLHPDIAELLKVCKVERVCIVFDADALMVKWEYDKDLSKRQNSFRKAASNFYKVLQYYVDSEEYALKQVWLVHIKRKFADQDAKGLDDLIAKKQKEKTRIATELLGITSGGESGYFDALELDVNYYTRLETYFGLENVQQFYKKYKQDIGKKQFVYQNARFVADEDENIRFMFHKDVEHFFRLGTDWMKIIEVPNKFGDTDQKVVPFSISEINRDYNPKAFPGFVDRIKKYDAYCNEPDWTERYKREHYGCYNLSNPITHRPMAGSCATTLRFIKHIFSGEGDVREYYKEGGGNTRELMWRIECVHPGDQFTVGMDWLSIFYRYPKQMLPVPILVSKEFGTGKSTFFKWLKSIYGSNVAILNNEQFKMRFNAHYITKSLIIIDEGFLDVDKKAEKERLKQLVTSDTNYVEHKGVNLQEFPYYGKVMIGSNDAESVMRMESSENRWFVVKVNPFKGKEDPDMELKLKQEIPAFLDFISTRIIAHPREQRLWFREDYFITEQFKQIVKYTKTRVEKNIDDLIKDMFLTFKVSTLRLSRRWIVEKLNEQSKYKTDQQEVKKYLDEHLGMSLQQPASINYPLRYDEDLVNSAQMKIVWSDKKVERFYEFKVDEWLSADDFQSEEHEKSFKKELELAIASEPQGSFPDTPPF